MNVHKDTLLRLRDTLHMCLDLMHDEAYADAKKEVVRAIEEIDKALASKGEKVSPEGLIELLGKIVDRLPWIVSLFKDLK